jgi:AraC-like DNA-binding protein
MNELSRGPRSTLAEARHGVLGASLAPMPSTIVTTEGLPPDAQFDAWRGFTAPCIDAQPRDGVEHGFLARSESWRFEPFLLQHSRLPACHYRRTADQAHRDDLDHWLIGICREGRHLQRSGDQVTDMAHGRPHVFRTAVAFHAERAGDAIDWIGLYLPRDAMPELDGALAAAVGRPLEGPSGELLAGLLVEMVRRLPAISGIEARHLAGSVTALLAAACAGEGRRVTQPSQDAVATSQLARIRRMIRADLGLAGLTPARLCRKANVSRSTLYRLFDPFGGVMRYIQRERLRLAHRRLSDPEERESVARIAEAAGLFDPSSFSRAFRREFGCTPAEVRAMARAGLLVPPARPQEQAGGPASLAAMLRAL